MTDLQAIALMRVSDRDSMYRTCTVVRTYHGPDGRIMEQRRTCRTLAGAISQIYAWDALAGTIAANLEVRT